MENRIRSAALVVLCMLPALWSSFAWAQGEREDIQELLKPEILSHAVADFQMRQYIIRGTAPLPKVPANSKEWTESAARLRQQLLRDVVFHGWPKEWVDSAPKFEDVGLIDTGGGYRIRKLRFEIVPGFTSSALLYEPDHLNGKVPAILNLSGHDGPLGYAYEFKQKRCISYAKHGLLALNLEWFAFGELAKEGNDHWFAAHLDLVGANGVGLFYLEMRRGLDYLFNHPNVDRKRIGVTGLSGGGWQTIVLSSLDERVQATNPVAGFSSLRSRVEVKDYGDMGDIEQSGTDFLRDSDYPQLVALMAPRPTLLTYNGEDDCCFRANIVRPRVYEAIQPFFRLYGTPVAFTWHENQDPGNHNYQLDNRLADYKFFAKWFGFAPIENEDGVAAEIKSYDELVTPLAKDNLSMLGVARRMGTQIARIRVPASDPEKTNWVISERTRLRDLVRYRPVELQDEWSVAMTKHRGLQSMSYLFHFSDGLTASGILLRSILQSSDTAPVTIVLNDKGIRESTNTVLQHFGRGEQVLALDLMFTGSAWENQSPFLFAQMLDSIGDRPVGMEAAQLIRVARWVESKAGVPQVVLEANGIRSQIVALVAAVLEPKLFSGLILQNGIRSFRYVLDKPVTFMEAPELFCLDLYRYFDIDSLQMLAQPATVQASHYLEIPENKQQSLP